MLIDVQIPSGVDFQIDPAVAGDLVKHVIEETQSRFDFSMPASVQIDFYADVGLVGFSDVRDRAESVLQESVDLCPICRLQRDDIPQCFHRIGDGSSTKSGLLVHPDRPAAQVFSQLHIGDTIADHKRIREIIFIGIEILGEHARARLTCRRLLMRKSRIDMNRSKPDPLAFKCPHDQIMHRLELICGE